MHTNLSVRIRKIILTIMLLGAILLPHAAQVDSSTANASVGDLESGASITANSLNFSTRALIKKHIISESIGVPACSGAEWQTGPLPKANSARGRVEGSSEYEGGCSPVASANTSRGLDRGEFVVPSAILAMPGVVRARPIKTYSKIYEGITNGGVMPVDNSPWPTWTDAVGDTYPNNPLIASHMGVDGRTTPGTIDDYWVNYESTAPDPYITGGWPQHAWGDAIADFMYTSQSAFDNRDGETQFYTYDNLPDQFTCDVMSSNSLPDGTLGIKQFYQARGYAVGSCYNQPTNNSIAGGFTFAQFKAEIDSGWPVLLGVQGHTIIGYGYNASSNLVYVYNGWDTNVHTMEWKENCYNPANNCSVSYKYTDPTNNFNMPLQFVSIVHIVSGTPASYTISGNAGTANATITYTGGSTTTDNSGHYSFTVTESWFGTVTPSKPGSTFVPANRSYANVRSSQTSQNYANQSSTLDADTTGVFRPTNGALYLKNSNTTGFADIQINYGLAGDYPVVGDWDGNGTVTIGIYRNGSFYLRNENTIGFANIVFPFGAPGDQPIAGDWNGDGIDTIGVYRNGTFFLRNQNSDGAPSAIFALGVSGDVGIAGDWNGDGMVTTGVFRPSNGALYLKNKNETGFADVQINYGLPGDKPVTGDWNNDGIDTIGVYRNGQFMLRNENTIGFADMVFDLGVPGDMPIAGDWDGLP